MLIDENSSFDNPVRDVLDKHGKCHFMSYMVYCEPTEVDMLTLANGISLVYEGDFYMDLEYVSLQTAIELEVYRGAKISFMFVFHTKAFIEEFMEAMEEWIEEGLEALRFKYELIESIKELKADV